MSPSPAKPQRGGFSYRRVALQHLAANTERSELPWKAESTHPLLEHSGTGGPLVKPAVQVDAQVFLAQNHRLALTWPVVTVIQGSVVIFIIITSSCMLTRRAHSSARLHTHVRAKTD